MRDGLAEVRSRLKAVERTAGLALKEAGKLREALADAAGKAERAVAENVELRKKVRMLVADPIYAVPKETARRVEELEEKAAALKESVRKAHVALTAKAAQDDLDALARHVEASDETVGGLQERVDELEEATTAPPASPPKPDPRQTTLEEHIAKANVALVPNDEDALPEERE